MTVDAEPDIVTVVVADTGRGLDAADMTRVFEPFWQVDTTLTRTDSGLGLGLAIVRSLVEAHGGTVRVESDGLGKGARFIVALPNAEAGARQGGAAGRAPAGAVDAG